MLHTGMLTGRSWLRERAVHLTTELARRVVERRSRFRPARFVAKIAAVLGVLALFGQAHAQTTERSWRNGDTTYFSGYAVNGAWWNGSQYRVSSTVHTDSYGSGWSRHCTTTTLGTTTTTECQ